MKSKHSCEKELKRTDKWMSPLNMTGDKWKCQCGKMYVYDEDESSGGIWIKRKINNQH